MLFVMEKQIDHSMQRATTVDKYAQWFARRLRTALGEGSQTGLVERMAENGLRILPGRISHYMQGRRYPDPPILKELAKALDVSADWLLGLTEQQLPVSDLEELLAQAKGESRINKLMKQLPPDKQTQIVEYAEYLVARQVEDETSLTQRQRDERRAERALMSVEKEFGYDVRVQLEKIVRARGGGSGT